MPCLRIQRLFSLVPRPHEKRVVWEQLLFQICSVIPLHVPVSLVPRPSLTAFFAAVAKSAFCHGCEKSCEGRPGYEAMYL